MPAFLMRPRFPCQPTGKAISADEMYERVTRRFPRIIARLAEGLGG